MGVKHLQGLAVCDTKAAISQPGPARSWLDLGKYQTIYK